MKKFITIFVLCLFVLECHAGRRHRRQYIGYKFVEQYGNQYGIYGPGGQGWINNYNNRYPNPNYAWNNNFNWNQGNRRPEWYYNCSETFRPGYIFVLLIILFSIFIQN